MRTIAFVLSLIFPVAAGPVAPPQATAPGKPIPAVGKRAPDFTLESTNGTRLTLSTELKNGPVVLVLLRGFPGYQCPFCVRQFGEFLAHGKELEAAGARVIWVYPGD